MEIPIAPLNAAPSTASANVYNRLPDGPAGGPPDSCLLQQFFQKVAQQITVRSVVRFLAITMIVSTILNPGHPVGFVFCIVLGVVVLYKSIDAPDTPVLPRFCTGIPSV